MLDWLVIGGGVHGTLVSRMLLGSGGCSPAEVRVLDPWPRALHRWWECTENVGMDYLRSSLVHHLDEDPMSLEKFARTRATSALDFYGQYQRPSLDLWRDHFKNVVREWDLDELRLDGRAERMRAVEGGYEVDTDRGSLKARHVVLALGNCDSPNWPGWACSLRAAGASIHHLFDPGFRSGDLPDDARLVIVGGGISAAQSALRLSRRNPDAEPVRILSRHPLRVFDFDTDSTWLGPRRIRSYERLSDPDARRRVIAEERHRGSTPPYVVLSLERAIRTGRIVSTSGEVDSARVENGVISLLSGGEELRADAVALATGFSQERPGGAFVDSVIEELELECASCGYPLVDRRLCWGGRLFVTGPLAELELGPAARNIHGARLAGKRLVDVAVR